MLVADSKKYFVWAIHPGPMRVGPVVLLQHNGLCQQLLGICPRFAKIVTQVARRVHWTRILTV